MDQFIHGHYRPSLVVLSFLVAVIAAYTALKLARRVQSTQNSVPWLWLGVGAIAMGSGIWSMHFIAMLALQLPIAVSYDVGRTFLSLSYAIGASGVAFWLMGFYPANWLTLGLGSLVMGSSIASMHYTGMAAIVMPGELRYDPKLVTFSVGVAVIASCGALWLTHHQQAPRSRWLTNLGSALAMGVAISGMHYTGMAATQFVVTGNITASDHSLNIFLGLAVGLTTLLLLGLTLFSSVVDERLSAYLVREQALRESERRFRMLIQEMRVGVLLLNGEAQILVANTVASEFLYNPETSSLPLIFGDRLCLISEAGLPLKSDDLPVQRAIATRQSVRDFIVGIVSPGATASSPSICRWLLINAEPQLAGGEVERVVCTLSDITLRRQVEDSLREQAEREQAATQTLQRMRETLDLNTIFETTTTELRQAVRCDRVVIYSFNPDWSGQIIAEAVAEGWTPILDHLEQPTSSVIDDETCWYRSRLNPRLGSVAHSLIEDSYLQTNSEGLFCHQAYRCVPDVQAQGFEPCYQAMLDQLQARAYLITPIHHSKQLWGLLCLYDNTAPRQWSEADIKVVSDISAHLGVAIQQAELFARLRQQTRALQIAKEAADAANKAKGDFLAHMSHELRTPLNAILGFSQLLSLESALAPQHREYIGIINNSGEHLLDLINDVLEMTKIEAGKLTLNPNVFDLRDFFSAIEKTFQVKAHAKGLKLKFHIPETAPNYIEADEGKLRQIIFNLVTNAIKFTDQGHVGLTAAIAAVTDAQQANMRQLRIQVEDTGVGISPAEQQDLFQAFSQTTSGRQSLTGSGLGLAISRRYAQLMGGDITVESQVNQGSIFVLSVPVIVAPALRPTATQMKAIPRFAAPKPSVLRRILVAEDDSDSRTVLCKLLENAGFAVATAEDGQETIRLWETWRPDLIWMDMKMPNLDGYAAIRRIRSTPAGRQTKILALTASAFEEERQAILDLGCDDFIRKPFHWPVILQKIYDHLEIPVDIPKTISKVPPAKADVVVDPPPSPASTNYHLSHKLSQLPESLLKAIQKAAILGDDRQIEKLLQEISSEHEQLALSLQALALEFQFDQILELVNTALHSVSRDGAEM